MRAKCYSVRRFSIFVVAMLLLTGLATVAADVRGAAGLFGLTATLPDGNIYRGVEYVECRTVRPGEAVLEITWQAVTQAFNEDFANVEELLATIEMPEESPSATPVAPRATPVD